MKLLNYKNSILCLLLLTGAIAVSRAQTSSANAAADRAGAPPQTWKEHWFEHDQLVKRVYFDRHVAFYYDDDVNRNLKWPFKKMSDVWAYVKKTYGEFGDSSRIYVIFHEGRYGGGHPSPYFDASHDFRNTLDCGLGNWNDPSGERIGIPIHEIGHIVTSASHQTKGSPSDVIWGDSKFMEIFNYDVLMHIGMQDEAEKVYAQMQSQTDDFPRAGSQWFKNWFYPIYKAHGKAAVLNKYFALLAANFPKDSDRRFTRDLNWGEFIHFWSGAAGLNLKAQATLAFGWPEDWEKQFRQAQQEFPKVKYKYQEDVPAERMETGTIK